MRVGWLVHDPGYVGGAELTQAEFKAAAPDGVEVVEMGPGEVGDADIYVAHNIPYHSLDDLRRTAGRPLTKYVHDAWPNSLPGVREWVLDRATVVFCSELHRRKFPHRVPDDSLVIPPPVALTAFKPSREQRRNGKRSGTCSIAQWRNPGKGAYLIDEWARDNGPVDVYGPGEFHPRGHNINLCGEAAPDDVPAVLQAYERFVFLPTDFEPFCRLVIEAHAAGCEVVTNRLVGAAEFVGGEERIENATSDFWDVVTERVPSELPA